MKLLIITQSGPEGLNRKIADTCLYMADDILKVNLTESKIRNASDMAPSEASAYTHVIMVVPEWNGSFPHTFKSLIDASGYPSSFKKKKILLVGTSDTTFGNIMGITHLEHILQWIGCFVDSKRICIPNIREAVDPIDGFRDHENRLYKAIKKFMQ
jgi:NAD(P)H-dependent FMN reductase